MYLFGLSQESEKIATDVPVLLVEEGGGQTQVPDTPSSPNPAAMSQRERRERKQMKHSSVFSQHTLHVVPIQAARVLLFYTTKFHDNNS